VAYVVRAGDVEVDVDPYLRHGKKFIRTRPDGDPADNLLNLPPC
jgi:hypothetical protein